MMVKIVPTLLTEKIDELKNMLNICRNFTDYVQIDIMDKEFVPSKSISFSDLEKINLPIEAELHLMVKDPLLWVRDWRKIKRIIYHYEIEKSHQEIIKAFKEKGFKVGMALNPQTPWQVLTEFLKDLDLVLFMSVNPGFYGSKFIPEVLEKIKEFRKAYPEKLIGIDGGIKYENIKKVIELKVNYIYIGSAIIKNPSPQEAFSRFKKLISE